MARPRQSGAKVSSFENLFVEADRRLGCIQRGDEVADVMAWASNAEDLNGQDISADRRMVKNPQFRELTDYMQAVKMGLKTEEQTSLETEVARFDAVTAASLKALMREITFSKNELQRQTSLSRVHAWFGEKMAVREKLREQQGLPSDSAFFSDEGGVAKLSRRSRYERTPSSDLLRPSTVNGPVAGSGASAVRMKRPSTAPVASQFEDVKLTGRLQMGGIKMRNLFASQRRRILKAASVSRAEQRRMIGQIADAQEAHAVDVEESNNMYSYLIGPNEKKTLRPRTASSKNMTKPSDTSGKPSTHGRPRTAGAPVPHQHVLPPETKEETKREAIEQERWLEQRWLQGRSDEAADERFKREVKSAMQQWAMNRGRIEEEISRRQESRRYASRSGRYYNGDGFAAVGSGFRSRPQSAAAATRIPRSRPSSAASGMTRAVKMQRPVSAAGTTRSPDRAPESVETVSKVAPEVSTVFTQRTPHSRPSARPVVETPVIVVRKPKSPRSKSPRKDRSDVETPARKTPMPMRFKYDAPPGFEDAFNKRNNALTPARRAKQQERAKAHIGPSQADRSLSPYRGDYGSVAVEDAFGARPRSPVAEPTWEAENTAFDGEFQTMANVFEDRQRAMDEDEYNKIMGIGSSAPKAQPGGGGGKKGVKKAPVKKAAKKGGKKKKGKGKKKSGPTVIKMPVVPFPRPGERVVKPRPMSAKRAMETTEVDAIADAFARKGLAMPCSKEALENALVIPEDTPYEVCIRNMPLDGGRLQMDPFAAERFKIYNPNAGTKKKKGVKKKGKKKK